jgi:sterol desaturase/sphingolipid hydroxylase (fatty acid hydroxylase superfamily)
MATSVYELEHGAVTPDVRGAEYPLYGQAQQGGPYNSHLVSEAVFVVLTFLGLVSAWLTAWIGACLVAAMLLDSRPWKRKVVPAAIPAQFALYVQVLARALWDALPSYAFAYLIYVCIAPLWVRANVAISSFVMLYGFYMLIRAFWLVRYLCLLICRWENAGRTFAVREVNLKSRSVAIRHVLWSYFLGNMGLVIRCSIQVMTIGLFERLRMFSDMDLARYDALSAHLVPISLAAATIWLATFWLTIRRALLIYYRTHRTFHNCLPLYASIHKIHHRAVLPTPLDSGTISPAEFLITEMALPSATLVPNWWWTISQIIFAFAGHWASHDSGTKRTSPQHHLHHHRLFNVNFGLSPAEDAQFGTLYMGPMNAETARRQGTT